MNNCMELKYIQYRFAYELTAFFLSQIKSKTKGEFEMLMKRVRSQAKCISDIMYTFDESIWLPNETESYNNLIRFHIRLNNNVETFTFDMLVDNGYDQPKVAESIIDNTRWIG